jgi:hypothetical protein
MKIWEDYFVQDTKNVFLPFYLIDFHENSKIAN